MSEGNLPEGPESGGTEIAPAQLEYALQQLRSEQNLPMGVLVGLAASLVGAGLWAGITVVTGYQIGFMAIGVGLLVGLAVRVAGKGIDSVFGAFGALLAFLGCAVGNLLAVCGMVARQEGMAFLDVVSQLTPALAQEMMVATFSPMDLLFYGLAIYEGYKLSFRQVTPDELGTLLPGH